MYTLFLKEVRAFLNSVIGYVVIGVFLVITGLFLWVFPSGFNILDMNYANIDGLFMIAPWVFLFLVPAITMRSFADETKTGTIELLFTKPLTLTQIIVPKFLADVVLLIISLVPTLIYFASVYYLGYPTGNIDQGAMWGSYIGLIFLGATFIAIGIFASTLTENQVVSFIIAAILCMFMYIGFDFLYNLLVFSSVSTLIQNLGISHHYASISRGVIDTRDLLYFLSVIVVFLALARLSLQSRRW